MYINMTIFTQLNLYDILAIPSLKCPYHLQQKHAPSTIMRLSF